MSAKTSRVKVLRISGGKREDIRDIVVRERPVTIFLNDVELATLMCSPKDLEYLAIGFLFAEGLVSGKSEIGSVLADEKDGVVWIETKKAKKPQKDFVSRRVFTTGCGRGLTFVDATRDRKGLKATSRLRMQASSVPVLMKEFQRSSGLFKLTGGVHTAALCSTSDILVFNEDIGRHSAIDKVIGECILKGIGTNDKVMMTSGRISSEILMKTARSHIPILISKSAPTDLAVKLANDLGITLVGFARGSRMNIYSKPWRLLTKEAREECV